MYNVIWHAAIGAIVGSVITYFAAVRNIHASAVIDERRKWRNKMRKLALGLASAMRDKEETKAQLLRDEIRMNLNPSDDMDRSILEETCAGKVSKRVSILLKHDWERAKLEASIFKKFLRYADRPIFCERLKREDFLKWKSGAICGLSFALLIFFPAIFIHFLVPLGKFLRSSWMQFSQYL
ncbi:hypothetical protein EKE94_04720 [Mesobaculum littorinae]|uniref:Uncharacterized protein n=1 Tax=Mesobaculum littorinae TaxID=2486419 RepID=A0A438AMH5_9RHOB|nr:hypothetical protein [Mesobaculum littorinae]RVV99958.1 hypothetical protein EKE94_04720 [Mesobaculum littorinae]